MLNRIQKLFSYKAANFKIQSFTFFIPTPPPRTTGYREKQFDKVFYEFINKGYEILSFNTQACTGQNQSGMWVICVVRALNIQAENLNFNDFINENLKNRKVPETEIEGLYYIDDISNDE
jgi:hypothetical protein